MPCSPCAWDLAHDELITSPCALDLAHDEVLTSPCAVDLAHGEPHSHLAVPNSLSLIHSSPSVTPAPTCPTRAHAPAPPGPHAADPCPRHRRSSAHTTPGSSCPRRARPRPPTSRAHGELLVSGSDILHVCFKWTPKSAYFNILKKWPLTEI